jgi:hypothetical protein
MSTQIDTDQYSESEQFQQQLPGHYRSILTDFRKITRSFAIFNGLFLFLGVLEIAALIFLLPWLNESAVLAIILSTLFLTLFSYFVLLFYYQAKKPEQLDELIRGFIISCQSSLGMSITASHHLSVAEALSKLSQYLTDYEGKMLQVPDRFPSLTRFITRLSANFYWRDVFNFKQQLLRAAIAQHLHQIRLTPTDIELHASLANAYVSLSQIYKEPKAPSPRPHLNFYKKHSVQCLEKFKMYGSLAIEEFQILNQYAPNDPWIHEQLAAGYRALSLPQEEIREVEFLFKLRPNDKEVLFLLGTLYFEQGLNAKGLQIYEELKKANFQRAENLISTYGQAAQFQDLLNF